MNEINNKEDYDSVEEVDNNMDYESITNNTFDKLPGILFGTWFIGSIIALLFLSEINGYYTVMVVGQLFFGFGICISIATKKIELFVIPFMLVGLLCIIIPFCMLHPELLDFEIDFDKLIVSLAILGFAIAGLLMVVLPIRKRKKLKEVCTTTVSATIVENLTHYKEGKTLYCPVYGFNFGGKSYRVHNNTYSTFEGKKVGTIVDFKINPNNPEEFLEDFDVMLVVMGVIFLLFSIPLFIFVMINGVG